MLLGGNACQRLEPVCVVCGTVFNGPVLHGVGHHIGTSLGKLAASLDYAYNFLVNILGKTLSHLLDGKDVLSKDLFYVNSLSHSAPLCTNDIFKFSVTVYNTYSLDSILKMSYFSAGSDSST